MDESLIYEVLSIVEEIPEGRVATYGQIAGPIGREKNDRLIGKILSMSQYYWHYPCHRVVNHAGLNSQDFLLQKGYASKKMAVWICKSFSGLPNDKRPADPFGQRYP